MDPISRHIRTNRRGVIPIMTNRSKSNRIHIFSTSNKDRQMITIIRSVHDKAKACRPQADPQISLTTIRSHFKQWNRIAISKRVSIRPNGTESAATTMTILTMSSHVTQATMKRAAIVSREGTRPVGPRPLSTTASTARMLRASETMGLSKRGTK